MDLENIDESVSAVVTINGRGPIRIEGTFELVNAAGIHTDIDGTIKICGCGRSLEKPICDGSHKK